MLNLDSIQHIQQFIALLIAYVPTVTIMGFLEAWSITLAGDDTAEEAGFLTLNPLKHIDVIGMLFLFLINWGFGQRIPYNPANITSPYKKLKIMAVLFTKPLVNLMLILISILALLFLTTTDASTISSVSSFKMSLLLIIYSLLRLNSIFFVIYFILGIANILVEFLIPDVYNRSFSISLIVGIVFPMILFLALQPYIQYGLILLLRSISHLF